MVNPEPNYRQIPTYDYNVSSCGHVWSNHNKKNIKPSIKNGYYSVGLWKNGLRQDFLVHRLVAKAWIDNPNNYTEINHKNKDRTDNNVANLEWVTSQQNNKHSRNMNFNTHSQPILLVADISVYFERVKEASIALKRSESSLYKQLRNGTMYDCYYLEYVRCDYDKIPTDQIIGFPMYTIDKKGNIYSKKTKRFIRPQSDKNGFLFVKLRENNQTYTRKVHILTALNFVPNPNQYPYVFHIDGDKDNNNSNNLQWNTMSNQMKKKTHNNRKIIQCSIFGNELEEFVSIKEAAKQTGSNDRSISSVCKGKRKTTNGYSWKYKS